MAFNLCFARSICPSGVQMPSAFKEEEFLAAYLLDRCTVSYLWFNLCFARSTCPSGVQIAYGVQLVLRTFNLPFGRSNAFGVQGGRVLGCLPVRPLYRYTVSYLWFNLCFARSTCPSGVQIAYGVQLVLCTFNLSFGRSNAFGVQGGRVLGCLPVIPLYRYTVIPLHRYLIPKAIRKTSSMRST